MHQNLKNADDFLAMLMDDVLLNIDKKYVKCHRGEILVHTTNFEHQLTLLSEVLHELEEANLKIDPEETIFAVEHVKFLGWIISSLGNLHTILVHFLDYILDHILTSVKSLHISLTDRL